MNTIIMKKKKAFTLIELIIVLAIMAIIAAIAIPNFTAVRENSKVKADTASCETIKRTALMLVSDETIATGTKYFTVAFSSTGVLSVTTDGVELESQTDIQTKEVNALTTAFKDVKAPQGKTMANNLGVYQAPTTTVAGSYKIDIDDSGNVLVSTIE
ncbi:MAG: prepilin-type N-terminal cleavage/methylation domain-containing protein [Clostridium sp.]|uniref:prepilin-type N-terminal cleavage/methylation domain-containing protein n=1 Tax=Clostridium sp. TaxID=1506 RepID=UPI003D6D9B1C